MIETQTALQLDEPTLQEFLVELRRLANVAGANEISEGLNQTEQSFKGGKLRLLLLGQFNHGKSLALNTLLGRTDLLPFGATPTTGIISEVSYGPEIEIALIDALGRRKRLSLEQYQQMAGELDSEKYRRAEILAPVPILKEITFVDTPGLSDPDSYDPETLGPEINRANVIIFFLSAVQPLTASEQVFIKEKLTAKGRKKLLFVLNQIDRLSEEDEQLPVVIDRVNKLLENLAPGATVLPFSAFEAAKGLQQQNIELQIRANYASVKTALTDDLLTEKERLQEANLLGGLQEATEKLEIRFEERKAAGQIELKGLEQARNGLDGERARLEIVRNRIQERGAAELERMSQNYLADLSAYSRRIAEKLPDQIIAAQQATPNDVSRNLPFYIEYALKNYLEARAGEFQEELRSYMQRVGEEIEREFTQTSEKLDPNRAYFLTTLPRLRQKDSVYTWMSRGVSGLGVITLFLTGNVLGGVLWLVAGEAIRQGAAMRGQERERLIEAGRSALHKSVEAAQKSMQSQFGDLQRTLGTEIAGVFSQNFAALQARLEELERQATLGGEERRRDIIAADHALSDLGDIKAKLNNLINTGTQPNEDNETINSI